MIEVYYIHRSHCSLCDIVMSEVKKVADFYEADFKPINTDTEQLPSRIEFIIRENQIFSLPIVFVREDDYEYEYFGKEDNGKISVEAIKQRLRRYCDEHEKVD